mmetsp:Transcript_6686/g.15915  ORF Transcript_6686/g.15915 Transcript_6686/m.15915 type:complete len:325 (+) Transcript_6686:68-1042(+)
MVKGSAALALALTSATGVSAVVRSGESVIFSDDFSNGLDFSVWKHEITAGGGGNWEFEYYTNNRSNSFVSNGTFNIKPTLLADRLGADAVDGTVPTTMELWGTQPADQCTGNQFFGCSRASGGGQVINPVQSARVRTAGTFSFKYGRVEVEAKLPKGDWLWPAIWLLPEQQAYGQWPASGEIDMVESRGNDASYPSGGANCFASTLHWGPYFPDDPYDLTTEQYCADSGNLSDDFHTYGLVWSKDEMYTYIDSEDNKVLSVPINESFWTKGGWDENPDIDNPWLGQGDNAPVNPKLVPVTTLTPPTTQTHSLSAPFANDQPHTC